MIKVLKFSSKTCHPCQVLEPIFNEVSLELKDQVVFQRIDVDENSALAIQYNIRSVPTTIIEKDNQLVDKIIGLYSKETLLNKLK